MTRTEKLVGKCSDADDGTTSSEDVDVDGVDDIEPPIVPVTNGTNGDDVKPDLKPVLCSPSSSIPRTCETSDGFVEVIIDDFAIQTYTDEAELTTTMDKWQKEWAASTSAEEIKPVGRLVAPKARRAARKMKESKEPSPELPDMKLESPPPTLDKHVVSPEKPLIDQSPPAKARKLTNGSMPTSDSPHSRSVAATALLSLTQPLTVNTKASTSSMTPVPMLGNDQSLLTTGRPRPPPLTQEQLLMAGHMMGGDQQAAILAQLMAASQANALPTQLQAMQAAQLRRIAEQTAQNVKPPVAVKTGKWCALHVKIAWDISKKRHGPIANGTSTITPTSAATSAAATSTAATIQSRDRRDTMPSIDMSKSMANAAQLAQQQQVQQQQQLQAAHQQHLRQQQQQMLGLNALAAHPSTSSASNNGMFQHQLLLQQMMQAQQQQAQQQQQLQAAQQAQQQAAAQQHQRMLAQQQQQRQAPPPIAQLLSNMRKDEILQLLHHAQRHEISLSADEQLLLIQALQAPSRGPPPPSQAQLMQLHQQQQMQQQLAMAQRQRHEQQQQQQQMASNPFLQAAMGSLRPPSNMTPSLKANDAAIYASRANGNGIAWPPTSQTMTSMPSSVVGSFSAQLEQLSNLAQRSVSSVAPSTSSAPATAGGRITNGSALNAPTVPPQAAALWAQLEAANQGR